MKTCKVLSPWVMLLSVVIMAGCGDDDGGQANPVCGNGVMEEGEACDLGDQNSFVTPDACRPTCVLPRCGDGVVDTGEACDRGDYNLDEPDSECRSDCTPPRCGDGICDGEETDYNCLGDCGNVGEPCSPDDPNNCGWIRRLGLTPVCLTDDILPDYLNSMYSWPNGFCTVPCDPYNDVGCEDVAPTLLGACQGLRATEDSTEHFDYCFINCSDSCPYGWTCVGCPGDLCNGTSTCTD